jgi:hypothetical protein
MTLAAGGFIDNARGITFVATFFRGAQDFDLRSSTTTLQSCYVDFDSRLAHFDILSETGDGATVFSIINSLLAVGQGGTQYNGTTHLITSGSPDNRVLFANNTCWFSVDEISIHWATIESGSASFVFENNLFYGYFNHGSEPTWQARNNLNFKPALNYDLPGTVELDWKQAGNSFEETFVGDSIGGPIDGRWRLSPNSKARGFGTDGRDIGAFSGAGSYRIAGIPAGPRIVEFEAPVMVNQESGLPIRIRAVSSESVLDND